LDLEKLILDEPEDSGGEEDQTQIWKLNSSTASVALVLNKGDRPDPSLQPPTPVVFRKSGRSLMGWELKRSTNAQGKVGFGLIRKQASENQK